MVCDISLQLSSTCSLQPLTIASLSLEAYWHHAVVLDEKIMDAVTTISSAYTDVVSLATRHTFGVLNITTSDDSDGKANASNVKIIKDIRTSHYVAACIHGQYRRA